MEIENSTDLIWIPWNSYNLVSESKFREKRPIAKSTRH